MSQSIVTRWMMDSEMEVPRLPIFKEISAKKHRSTLNVKAMPFISKNRIVSNKDSISKSNDRSI